LKLGHVQTVTHSYHIGAQYFADKLSEESNGRITVDVFPSSQIGNERDLAEGVQMGTIDAAIVGVAVLANFDPTFEIFNLPFLFRDREHAYHVLDGSFGIDKFGNLEKFDITGLGYFENGFFDLLSNGLVDAPADAVGMNVRTMENSVYMGIFKAIGANPVPMSFNEVYTSLQNGTVDGACVSITALAAPKFYEVASNFAIIEMCFSPTPLIISKEVFNEMPKEYQELIKKVAKEAVDIQRLETIKQEEEAAEIMNKAGCFINTVKNKELWEKAIVDDVYRLVEGLVPKEDIETIKNTK